jgi:hypothetical protein
MQFRVTHAHRNLLSLVLLLVAAPWLAAQTQSFGITSFTPPSGWDSALGGDHITFTFIDQSAGSYVMLAVYESTSRSGDPEKDFASEWKNVVVKSFSEAPAPRSVSNRTKSGLEFREGGANVSKNGAVSYVRLMVFPSERKMFSVLAVASHQGAFEGKQAVVRSFLDSMKIAAQPASTGRPPVTLGTSSSGSSGAIGAGGAPRSGSGITGVWLGFKANYPSYEPRPRWYVFYEDGTVFEDLPRSGLAGFNRQVSKTDSGQHSYWGSYSVAGSSATITKPGVNYPEKIVVENPGKIKIDGLYFNRCRPVDGLRLQGAWTSYANPNDPSLDRLPRGKSPVFHFTSDGKFIDDGVLAVFLSEGHADQAGSGEYEIRDFTLVLRYSDGRIKTLAFSGLCPGDASTSNDLIFIGRSGFRKRK